MAAMFDVQNIYSSPQIPRKCLDVIPRQMTLIDLRTVQLEEDDLPYRKGSNATIHSEGTGTQYYDKRGIIPMYDSQETIRSSRPTSTASMKVHRISSFLDGNTRFPKLEDCAHFHYDTVELGTINACLCEDEHEIYHHNGEDFGDHIFYVKVTSNEQTWTVRRTFQNFRMLDQKLHRCIFDRKFSHLADLWALESGDVSPLETRDIVAEYLQHFSSLAGSRLNCGSVLNWLEIDNRGNHLVAVDDSGINIPAIAAAHAVRRYMAQAADEISLEVGDIISVIDMPPKDDTIWWRGKRGFEVGFFPWECAEVIGDKVPPAVVTNIPETPSNKALLKKHGKFMSFLRLFFTSRPARIQLKQSGIFKERVFGCDLGEHLLNSGHDVPLVLKSCADMIETHCMVDGIYRLSGITSNIQKLRLAFDEDRVPDLTSEVYLQDVHSISSLLKMYFRELPNPLLTYGLYDKFAEAVRDEENKLMKIHDIVQQLPPPHYRTTEYLMRHLSRVAAHGGETCMHSKNLAIVWAPNLLRSKELETGGGAAALQGVGIQAVVTEFLILYAELIFSDKMPTYSSPELKKSTKKPRPKSLAISTPTRLLTLEEARERALNGNMASPNQKYIDVGGGPNKLPAKYHTVIDLPGYRKKGSRDSGVGKVKKSPAGGLRSLFTKSRSGSIKDRHKDKSIHENLNFDSSERKAITEEDVQHWKRRRIRSAKSAESLLSLPITSKLGSPLTESLDPTKRMNMLSGNDVSSPSSCSRSMSMESPRALMASHDHSVSFPSFILDNSGSREMAIDVSPDDIQLDFSVEPTTSSSSDKEKGDSPDNSARRRQSFIRNESKRRVICHRRTPSAPMSSTPAKQSDSPHVYNSSVRDVDETLQKQTPGLEKSKTMSQPVLQGALSSKPPRVERRMSGRQHPESERFYLDSYDSPSRRYSEDNGSEKRKGSKTPPKDRKKLKEGKDKGSLSVSMGALMDNKASPKNRTRHESEKENIPATTKNDLITDLPESPGSRRKLWTSGSTSSDVASFDQPLRYFYPRNHDYEEIDDDLISNESHNIEFSDSKLSKSSESPGENRDSTAKHYSVESIDNIHNIELRNVSAERSISDLKTQDYISADRQQMLDKQKVLETDFPSKDSQRSVLKDSGMSANEPRAGPLHLTTDIVDGDQITTDQVDLNIYYRPHEDLLSEISNLEHGLESIQKQYAHNKPLQKCVSIPSDIQKSLENMTNGSDLMSSITISELSQSQDNLSSGEFDNLDRRRRSASLDGLNDESPLSRTLREINAQIDHAFKHEKHKAHSLHTVPSLDTQTGYSGDFSSELISYDEELVETPKGNRSFGSVRDPEIMTTGNKRQPAKSYSLDMDSEGKQKVINTSQSDSENKFVDRPAAEIHVVEAPRVIRAPLRSNKTVENGHKATSTAVVIMTTPTRPSPPGSLDIVSPSWAVQHKSAFTPKFPTSLSETKVSSPSDRSVPITDSPSTQTTTQSPKATTGHGTPQSNQRHHQADIGISEQDFQRALLTEDPDALRQFEQSMMHSPLRSRNKGPLYGGDQSERSSLASPSSPGLAARPRSNRSSLASPDVSPRSNRQPRPSYNQSPQSEIRNVGQSPLLGNQKESPQLSKRLESPQLTKQHESPQFNKKQESPQFGKKQGSPQFGKKQESPQFGKKQESPQFGKKQESPQFGKKQESPQFGKKQGSPQFGKKQDSPPFGKKQESQQYGKKHESPQLGKKQESPQFDRKNESPQIVKKESPPLTKMNDSPQMYKRSPQFGKARKSSSGVQSPLSPQHMQPRWEDLAGLNDSFNELDLAVYNDNWKKQLAPTGDAVRLSQNVSQSNENLAIQNEAHALPEVGTDTDIVVMERPSITRKTIVEDHPDNFNLSAGRQTETETYDNVPEMTSYPQQMPAGNQTVQTERPSMKRSHTVPGPSTLPQSPVFKSGKHLGAYLGHSSSFEFSYESESDITSSTTVDMPRIKKSITTPALTRQTSFDSSYTSKSVRITSLGSSLEEVESLLSPDSNPLHSVHELPSSLLSHSVNQMNDNRPIPGQNPGSFVSVKSSAINQSEFSSYGGVQKSSSTNQSSFSLASHQSAGNQSSVVIKSDSSQSADLKFPDISQSSRTHQRGNQSATLMGQDGEQLPGHAYSDINQSNNSHQNVVQSNTENFLPRMLEEIDPNESCLGITSHQNLSNEMKEMMQEQMKQNSGIMSPLDEIISPLSEFASRPSTTWFYDPLAGFDMESSVEIPADVRSIDLPEEEQQELSEGPVLIATPVVLNRLSQIDPPTYVHQPIDNTEEEFQNAVNDDLERNLSGLTEYLPHHVNVCEPPEEFRDPDKKSFQTNTQSENKNNHASIEDASHAPGLQHLTLISPVCINVTPDPVCRESSSSSSTSSYDTTGSVYSQHDWDQKHYTTKRRDRVNNLNIQGDLAAPPLEMIELCKSVIVKPKTKNIKKLFVIPEPVYETTDNNVEPVSLESADWEYSGLLAKSSTPLANVKKEVAPDKNISSERGEEKIDLGHRPCLRKKNVNENEKVKRRMQDNVDDGDLSGTEDDVFVDPSEVTPTTNFFAAGSKYFKRRDFFSQGHFEFPNAVQSSQAPDSSFIAKPEVQTRCSLDESMMQMASNRHDTLGIEDNSLLLHFHDDLVGMDIGHESAEDIRFTKAHRSSKLMSLCEVFEKGSGQSLNEGEEEGTHEKTITPSEKNLVSSNKHMHESLELDKDDADVFTKPIRVRKVSLHDKTDEEVRNIEKSKCLSPTYAKGGNFSFESSAAGKGDISSKSEPAKEPMTQAKPPKYRSSSKTRTASESSLSENECVKGSPQVSRSDSACKSKYEGSPKGQRHSLVFSDDGSPKISHQGGSPKGARYNKTSGDGSPQVKLKSEGPPVAPRRGGSPKLTKLAEPTKMPKCSDSPKGFISPNGSPSSLRNSRGSTSSDSSPKIGQHAENSEKQPVRSLRNRPAVVCTEERYGINVESRNTQSKVHFDEASEKQNSKKDKKRRGSIKELLNMFEDKMGEQAMSPIEQPKTSPPQKLRSRVRSVSPSNAANRSTNLPTHINIRHSLELPARGTLSHTDGIFKVPEGNFKSQQMRIGPKPFYGAKK